LRYFYHAELHGLRILPLPKFEKYILFYRFKEDEHVVEIVRIVHGRARRPSHRRAHEVVLTAKRDPGLLLRYGQVIGDAPSSAAGA
jgi:hypothetical protein